MKNFPLPLPSAIPSSLSRSSLPYGRVPSRAVLCIQASVTCIVYF